MHPPFLIPLITLITASAGGAAILDENSLVPLSVFAVGVITLTGAAWRLSAAFTRHADSHAQIERVVVEIKKEIEALKERVGS